VPVTHCVLDEGVMRLADDPMGWEVAHDGRQLPLYTGRGPSSATADSRRC
jgi:hypothetical protein